MESLRENVFEYTKNEYGVEPEYLWARFPDFAVLRRKDSKKWFGIIMNVNKNKFFKNE